MESKEAIGSQNISLREADFERTTKLKDRLERLLREAAEAEAELSRADGTIKGVPHYSLIEGRAHELGKRLSREVQQRQMSELAASQAVTAKCPECGMLVRLHPRQRDVKSVDGDTALQELVGDCPRCRRSFFPATRDFGA
jgi:DNA-directed RNA polymerase subunit RPC12/RpoP